MSPQLNLQSRRAQEAKVRALLDAKVPRFALIGFACVAGALGVALLVFGAAYGWLLLGCAVGALSPVWWYKMHLQNLPVFNGGNVDDILDPSILGALRGGESPQMLAEITMRQQGGLFFAARFGVGPNFLRDMNSSDPAAMAAVWQEAYALQAHLNLSTLSAPVIVAALVKTVPDYQTVLAHLQLDFDDILAGVQWYHHLLDTINEHKKRSSSGGIGRDLSFGWTPLLAQFAKNISLGAGTKISRKLEGHGLLLAQLMDQLSRGSRHNAVLIGPAGSGKTTLVYSMAEQLLRGDKSVPANLRYCQVMALDAAALISHAHGRGELEALLNNLLVEAYHAKNIIIFLDNAELFFADGTGSVDVRNILLPILEGGALRMVLAMDEQQWLSLTRATPNLAQQLNRLSVPPMDETDTRLVCEDEIIMYEYSSKVTYMYQAIAASYRLGARYVTDFAMPAQALRILEAAAKYAENGLVTAHSVEKAVEQAYGVRVATAQQGDERQTLLHLEDLLHERMINQNRAVAVVANALRRARSGVRNQNRPIGSFLFLGPTGVGKTELAKALAAVYFGGEDRIVRLDLNEFSQPQDVARLIADGANDPHSLTAQIAKQPFSVVLLDEIEKAHPNILNTLLQLLDEGILRDTNNREISFRDAVVIATSNAGADRVRQYIQAGYQLEQFEDHFIHELIDANYFKPEFLNRFDEMVLFRPLTEDELLQVVDLMLAGVNKALATQRVSVTVAEDAKRRLVQVGNDPRLGARPLRRVVQRTVENIVAQQLLEGSVTPGQAINITLADVNGALQK